MQFIWIEANQHDLLSQVSSLADEILGRDYLTENRIAQLLNKPEHKILGCLSNGQLRAFSLASIQQNDKIEKLFEIFEVAVPTLNHQNIGCMQTAAVSMQWQKKGIGLEMATRRIAWLLENGCLYLYGISWDHDGCTSKSVLEKVGFKTIAYREALFEKISPGCFCPRCEPNPCRCGGHLLVRRA